MWPFHKKSKPVPVPPKGMFDNLNREQLLTLEDSSLVVALCERICPPSGKSRPFAALNETERVLITLHELDGYVIGEGFDAWLMYAGEDALRATPQFLESIGAFEVATLVRTVLVEMSGAEGDELGGLPDSAFEAFDRCGMEYTHLSPAMWKRLGTFARSHIDEIRWT